MGTGWLIGPRTVMTAGHCVYMHERGWEYVHETPGPMAAVTTRSYLSRYWEERGLWRVYQEDYARRSREGGAIAVWPSPLPEEDFMDSYVAARAVEWLQQVDTARPFCAWIAFGGPHTPWDAPGHYATMYDPADVPDPIPAPEPPDWLPAYARERMLTDPAGVAALDAHRDFASAVPTPDHFIPLLYLAGLAAVAGDGAASEGAPRDGEAALDSTTRVLVDGCAYGSLSMTAYTLGLDVPAAAGTGLAAQAPDGVPADGTNL